MLKNMNERKAFLKDYRSWGVYVEVSELGMRVFRKELPDQSAILACEFKTGWHPGVPNPNDGEWWPAKFQLIRSGNSFRPAWDSESYLIEHIMRIKET